MKAFLFAFLATTCITTASGTIRNRQTLPDDLAYDLLPGMRFSLKARFDAVPGWNGNLVGREGDGCRGGYFLRVDPPNEARLISFFVDVDGKPEPRVSSRRTVRTGVWYDLAAGWDGTNIWLSVNGDVTKKRRPGNEAPAAAPLRIGLDGAEIADFRFTPGRSSRPPAEALTAGLRLNCSIVFDEVPTTRETELLVKSQEYMVRYENNPSGGCFSFFVFLDGGWEPRVSIPTNAVAGVRYDLAASWDGTRSSLSIGDRRATVARRGKPSPGPSALRPGRHFRGKILRKDVRACPLKRPLLEQFKTRELTLTNGCPFTLTAELTDVGDPLDDCTVLASGPDGCTVRPAEMRIGRLENGAVRPCSWTVDPGTNVFVSLRFKVMDAQRHIRTFSKRLATMPTHDPDLSARVWNPPVSGRTVMYVDARDGDDARDGRSPATAWKTLAKVRGLRLGPGDRLLLKRGSVFEDELRLDVCGAPHDWAEVGAYGEGFRPTIRRRRDIDDRCAFFRDAEYLVVRDLIVCNAGKGLIVECTNPNGNGHILVERCLAHHIEGLYRFNSHGIPEWRDRSGATPGQGRGGIGLTGPGMRKGVMRDCEMYQCSSCFSSRGDDMWLGRLFCHDSFCPNTSPHPFYTSTWRAWLVDSVFDASGYLASCGTMGIMLGFNQGLCIRGCHFLNMPHTGLCGDEGGIDFEAGGDNAVIRGCTFRNNAGAAIEVLGLRSPQARNNRFVGCRFDRNNRGHMLGPSEIYIWGGSRDRTIVCSNGLIADNGYVLLPGVSFFTNVSDLVRDNWKLERNRQFATFEEMDRALPLDNPPSVEAGDEIWTDDGRVTLDGRVSDDGRGRGPLVVGWEQLEGPDTVRFADAAKAVTDAEFPGPGDYRLNLRADDGQLWRTDRTAVHILPKGTRAIRAWNFAQNLDTEGWSTNALGTAFERFPSENVLHQTHAYPVASVGGDFFVIALKDSSAGAIVSPGGLALRGKGLRLLAKLQNHTPARRMRLSFATAAGWQTACFDVVPNDEADTLYSVPLPADTDIRQLKLAFTDGTPVTGTVRIDYLTVVADR